MSFKSDEFGEYTAELHKTVKKSSVERWWPNGYGSQTLYGLQIKWEDARINDSNGRDRSFYSATKTINIGFRTIELMQDKMSNGFSFYFKVNDVPIFMKGSNWIPSHILPEKSAKSDKVKELLEATRDANMNMLRVWGGGVYESNYFYSLADEFGILIWQDLMFACAMYPSDEDFLDSVRLEVKLQVRRIQHHPSIAIFATNNENEVALRQNWYGTNSRFREFASDYHKLYVETVTDEIKKLDLTREVLTSSPSNGNYNGDREYGIGMDPQNPHYGDIHFYEVDHNAWLSVNFHQPRFTSEYGFQSFPAGWKEVLRKGDNLTNLIDHRQHYPFKSRPITFLVEENLNVKFNSLKWEDKVYLSQLSQAMAVKTETEVYRAGRGTFMNTMGALYWQLNDVWVAPSWSSIEYNGNFKVSKFLSVFEFKFKFSFFSQILHHWVKQIFAPQTVVTQMTLLKKLLIYAISDEINVETKPVTIKMQLYRWVDFQIVNSHDWHWDMTPNAVSLVVEFDIYKHMADLLFDVNKHMAEFLLINDSDGKVLSRNYAFPGSFKEIKSIGDPKPELRISSSKCEKSSHRLSLEIKIEKPAVFMSLSLDHENIKKHQLSKNGFMQFEPIQVVQVTFVNPDCREVITASNFVIKTLNEFL